MNVKFVVCEVFHTDRVKISARLKYRYYSSIGKYFFYTHMIITTKETRNEQVRFFLTHGTPLKNSTGCFWPPDDNTYILSTSPFAAELRCKSFQGGWDRIQLLGFPRNDRFFKPDVQTIQYVQRWKDKKLIVGLPTFKHHRNKLRNDFSKEKDMDILLLNVDFINRLEHKLAEYNLHLFIKLHPNQNLEYIEMFLGRNISMMTNSQLLNEGLELYSILSQAEALITDFSSVFFDFLLHDKPIAFDLSNLDDYSTGRGFMVESPLDYMPGEKIYGEEDFITFLEHTANGEDLFAAERDELCNKIHTYKDGNSSKRIVEFMKFNH